MNCFNCGNPIEKENGEYVHSENGKFSCFRKTKSGKPFAANAVATPPPQPAK